MHVSELALKAIKGFSQKVRIPLAAGYQCLVPPGPESVPLIELFSSLFFPDVLAQDAEWLSFAQPDGKVALTLVDRRGQEYRLTKETGKSASLQRWNESLKSAEFLGRNSQDIGQFLRSQVGIPTTATFHGLYCFRSRYLPSQRMLQPALGENVEPPRTRPVFVMAPDDVPPAADVDAARLRVSELEKESALAGHLEALHFQLDGLEAKAFECQRVLKALREREAEVALAQREFDAAPTLASLGLPHDILNRAQGFSALRKTRDESVLRLQTEVLSIQERTPSAKPLLRQKPFLLNVLAGVVLLVVAAFLSGKWRALAWLDVFPFSYAALLAWRNIEEKEETDKAQRQLEYLGQKQKQVEDAFAKEESLVAAAFQKAGVRSAEELSELLEQKATSEELLQRARRELEEMSASMEVQNASQLLAKLQAQKDAIDEELKKHSGTYIRPQSEVVREMTRVKASIDKAVKSRASPEVKRTPAPTQAPTIETTSALMSLAADELQMEVEVLAAHLKPRVAQFLKAWNSPRLNAVHFDKKGNVSVLEGKSVLPLSSLSSTEADQTYWAVHMAALERCLSKKSGMVVIDENYSLAKGPQAKMVAAAFAHLGKVSQVLHVTRQPLTSEIIGL